MTKMTLNILVVKSCYRRTSSWLLSEIRLLCSILPILLVLFLFLQNGFMERTKIHNQYSNVYTDFRSTFQLSELFMVLRVKLFT